MYFSIIIPTRNLSKYLLDECLPAIDKLIYHDFETIVLPNEKSKDDKLLEKKYPWLKIIPTGKITKPAQKRDIGAKISRGNILAFIDDDAYPDKNWLKNAQALFPIKNKKIAAVCGPGILPKKTNIWEKIFDEILRSPIGSGGYNYRFFTENEKFVDDYPSMNFLIKKSIFMKLGGFNNDYWPGEDSKLCEDIVYKEKGLIYYHPGVLVYHHRRNNLIEFLRQHGSYGFHRGAFFAHGDRNSRRLSYLIPTFFVLYLIFMFIFLQLFSHFKFLLSVLYTPLVIYINLLLFLLGLSYLNTKNIIITFLSPFVLFLTHITYGIMFIKGFIIGAFKKNNIYS